MNVKIDTKEKFTVITPEEAELPANMTEELASQLRSFLTKQPPHIVFNMNMTKTVSPEVCEMLSDTQQEFYEQNCSFVICQLPASAEAILAEKDLLDTMNITPSESEAWDIVQMEEIERELMNGEWDDN